MKTLTRRRFLPVVLLAACLSLHAAETPDAEKTPVTKIDGSKVFGLVEITDDYTIKISSDSGLQKIPLALLGEKDFRKYGFSKDRSKDGRFWSERKDALETAKQDEAGKKEDGAKKSDSADIEIRLAELAPFQPLIAAYENIKPPQAASAEKEETKEGDPAKPAGKSSTLHMFSGPGSFNIPTVPFASSAAGAVIQPAASAASSAARLAPVTGLVTPP